MPDNRCLAGRKANIHNLSSRLGSHALLHRCQHCSLACLRFRYPGSQGKQYFLGLEKAFEGSGNPIYPGEKPPGSAILITGSQLARGMVLRPLATAQQAVERPAATVCRLSHPKALVLVHLQQHLQRQSS